MSATSGRDLAPIAREGRPFRWTEKRSKQVVLDSQGVPDAEIAEIVGLQVHTVHDNRLHPEYRERLAELRNKDLAEIVPLFQRFQKKGAEAGIAALETAMELLTTTVYNADGVAVPNMVSRAMGVKLITDLMKVGFGKWFGVGGDDGGGERLAEGAVIRATVRLELPSGDGSPRVTGYEVIDGDYTEVKDG